MFTGVYVLLVFVYDNMYNNFPNNFIAHVQRKGLNLKKGHSLFLSGVVLNNSGVW